MNDKNPFFLFIGMEFNEDKKKKVVWWEEWMLSMNLSDLKKSCRL